MKSLPNAIFEIFPDHGVLGDQPRLRDHRVGDDKTIKRVPGPVYALRGLDNGVKGVAANPHAKIFFQGLENSFRFFVYTVDLKEELHFEPDDWGHHQFKGFNCFYRPRTKPVYFTRIEPQNRMRVAVSYGRHR
jgi:hypothetical protein